MIKFNKIKNILSIRYIAMFLLLNVATVITLTSIFFLLGFKINSGMFIFESLFGGFLTYLIFKNEINKKIIINSMIIAISIIYLSIALGGTLYDYSWDGNIYHKQSIGLMKEGVNPVYNNELGDPWVKHYPKAAETYAAVVYAYTDNIESGKAIYFILIISLFLLFFDYLVKKKRNILQSLILSFVTVFSPVVVAQYSTYYVDGIVALTLFLLILSGITILDKEYKYSLFSKLAFFSSSIIICVNLKFTALFLAGILRKIYIKVLYLLLYCFYFQF